MSLKAKPIYIIEPDKQWHCGTGLVPYYYKDELDNLQMDE